MTRMSSEERTFLFPGDMRVFYWSFGDSWLNPIDAYCGEKGGGEWLGGYMQAFCYYVYVRLSFRSEMAVGNGKLWGGA